ncbi:hypothetical protein GCM10010191_17130 [Actinomadura vinacea]|uniref:Uncharacterized protein n=1 Tax=Actinomadura vinacea TaxID=115336 RepID=A0ABN3IMF0_9ACTN
MFSKLIRTRTPLTLLGILMVLSEFVHGIGLVALAGAVPLVLGVALSFAPVRVTEREPIELRGPVTGRCPLRERRRIPHRCSGRATPLHRDADTGTTVHAA